MSNLEKYDLHIHSIFYVLTTTFLFFSFRLLINVVINPIEATRYFLFFSNEFQVLFNFTYSAAYLLANLISLTYFLRYLNKDFSFIGVSLNTQTIKILCKYSIFLFISSLISTALTSSLYNFNFKIINVNTFVNAVSNPILHLEITDNTLIITPLTGLLIQLISIIGIIFYLIFAAVNEEILYRSVLLQIWSKKTNPVFTTVIISTLFSLSHIKTSQQISIIIANSLSPFLFSCLMCFIYLKYKNIWITSIPHIAWNVVQVFLASNGPYCLFQITHHKMTTFTYIFINLILLISIYAFMFSIVFYMEKDYIMKTTKKFIARKTHII